VEFSLNDEKTSHWTRNTVAELDIELRPNSAEFLAEILALFLGNSGEIGRF
jgi:hypothetical protein